MPNYRSMIAVLLASALSSAASIDEFSVSPTNTNVGGFLFNVSANQASNATVFQIQITDTKAILPKYSSNMGVRFINLFTNGSEVTDSVPYIPVTMKTNDRIRSATFVVPTELQNATNLFFILSVVDKKMPSGIFYELNLHDFSKSKPRMQLQRDR